MKKLYHLLVIVIGISLTVVVSPSGHVFAQAQANSMIGIHHVKTSGSSQVCATICTSGVGREKFYGVAAIEDDDLEPEPPRYLSSLVLNTSPNLQRTTAATEPRVIAKVPIYILYERLRP